MFKRFVSLSFRVFVIGILPVTVLAVLFMFYIIGDIRVQERQAFEKAAIAKLHTLAIENKPGVETFSPVNWYEDPAVLELVGYDTMQEIRLNTFKHDQKYTMTPFGRIVVDSALASTGGITYMTADETWWHTTMHLRSDDQTRYGAPRQLESVKLSNVKYTK